MPHLLWHGTTFYNPSPKTLDTHTCCRAFRIGVGTTCLTALVCPALRSNPISSKRGLWSAFKPPRRLNESKTIINITYNLTTWQYTHTNTINIILLYTKDITKNGKCVNLDFGIELLFPMFNYDSRCVATHFGIFLKRVKFGTIFSHFEKQIQSALNLGPS